MGAGCSVCGGYPVADQVREKMLNFGRTRLIHDEAKELRRCVEQTCSRMEELNVHTIDQLAEKLVNPSDEVVVREAKLAMSAYFFSIEEAGVELAYPNYSAFFDELFKYGESHFLEDRIKATPCRVITYNYDRLFERTFIKWAKANVPDDEDLVENSDSWVKKWLSMGISSRHKIDFPPISFSLLKLHGGIGQFNRTGDYGMNHIYWPKLDTKLPDFNDEPYFQKHGQETNFPTILFPSDKKRRKMFDEENSFRAYMDTVEKQAKVFCREATEIQIIGYSVQCIDYFSFKSLITDARKCRRVILQNRSHEKDRLTHQLENLREELGADWTIEFRARDFGVDAINHGKAGKAGQATKTNRTTLSTHPNSLS